MSTRTTIIGSADTTIDDFVGTWIQTGAGTFEWIDGPLTTALTDPACGPDSMIFGPSLAIHCAERIPAKVWAELAEAVTMLREGIKPSAVAAQARYRWHERRPLTTTPHHQGGNMNTTTHTRWDDVATAVEEAVSIAWDGCHKIYVLMDEGRARPDGELRLRPAHPG